MEVIENALLVLVIIATFLVIGKFQYNRRVEDLEKQHSDGDLQKRRALSKC